MPTEHGGKTFQELSRIAWSVHDDWAPDSTGAQVVVTAGALQEIRGLLRPISELARKQLDREQQKASNLNRRVWDLVHVWAEPLEQALRRMRGHDASLARSALWYVKAHVRREFDSFRFPATQAGYTKFCRWVTVLLPGSIEILRVNGVGTAKAAAWRKLLVVNSHAQAATD